MAYVNFGQVIYPVGSVYMSYTSISPASLFGGNWAAITGHFPYFNNGTGTGGSNTVTHRHWMPIGKENGSAGLSTTAKNGWIDGSTYDIRAAAVYHSIYLEDMYLKPEQGNATETTTYDTSINNMPAYQTFYAWRRTS